MQFYNVHFSCKFILIGNFIINIIDVISSSSLFAYKKECLVAAPLFCNINNTRM